MAAGTTTEVRERERVGLVKVFKKEMERSGGMVTGSHERNELVTVRHGSDSGVRSSGSVPTLLLHWTFPEDHVSCFSFWVWEFCYFTVCD